MDLLHLPPGGWLSLGASGVELTTDDLALRHLSWIETATWAAASTSALVLGTVGFAELNEEAWGQLALLGHLLTPHTAFDGVHRVPPLTTAALSAGTVHLMPRDPPQSQAGVGGAQVIRDVVEGLLSAYPDAALELSGGLDSRLILGAITPSNRRNRLTITLGAEGDPDVELARSIAAKNGLDHRVLPLGGLAADPDELMETVHASALNRDFIGDGIFGALIDQAEARFPQLPRFTGMNGEYIRGFYYPGTLPWSRVSDRSVQRLIKWRMTTNSRLPPTLFDADWLVAQHRRLGSEILSSFVQAGPSLRLSSDDFYLRQRVPNWAGVTYSTASHRRDVLAPFAHRDFVGWADHVSPGDRAGSRVLASILSDLDADLAAIPLASGRQPTEMQSNSARARLIRATSAGGKLAAKVRQVRSQVNRPPSGASAVASSLCSMWPTTEIVGAVQDINWLATSVRNGDTATWHALDSAAANFLINLAGVRQFRNRVDRMTRV